MTFICPAVQALLRVKAGEMQSFFHLAILLLLAGNTTSRSPSPSAAPSVTMLIAYPATPVFNSTYYLAHHVPAVAEAWQPYGLTGYRALLSQAESSPYAVIFEAEWPDMDAVNDMLTRTPEEEKRRFEEDEKRFTDKGPGVWVMGVGAQG